MALALASGSFLSATSTGNFARLALTAEDDVARSAAVVQAAGCSLMLNPSPPSA